MAELVLSRLLLISMNQSGFYLLPDKQVHERVKDKEDPRGSLFGMYLSWSRRVLGISRHIRPWPEQGDENGDKAE